MSVEFNHKDYTTGKQILMFPDHYVGLAHTFNKQDSAAVQEDGRYIVKAGTIYPANDNTALGVVMNDYDVTNGDISGTLIVHGFIKTAKIPAVPTAQAKAALKQITFFPLAAITVTLKGTGVSVTAGEALGTTHRISVGIEGASFRPAATTKTNWTITGESDSKVSIDSIEISADGNIVTFVTKNSAAAAAGSVTVVPKAAATSTGDVPTQALTIVTVSE